MTLRTLDQSAYIHASILVISGFSFNRKRGGWHKARRNVIRFKEIMSVFILVQYGSDLSLVPTDKCVLLPAAAPALRLCLAPPSPQRATLSRPARVGCELRARSGGGRRPEGGRAAALWSAGPCATQSHEPPCCPP